MVAKAHGHGHVGATGPDGYKRDKKGQFAKVNTLVKKIALAKAQGVKHIEPGPSKKVPPPWSAIHGTNAKADGLKIYNRKKAGEFSDDHEIYLAAKKLASAYKKNHPGDQNTASANQIVNAYKRHEYEETGQVMLLGKIEGKIDPNGPGSEKVSAPPSKPTIDSTKSGISISSSKFDKPDTLKPTGKTLGGVTGAKIYTDAKGQEWVVKAPKSGSKAYSNGNYLVDIEVAASRIQNKAGLPVPAMHAEEVDGKMSAVSKMYKGPFGKPAAEAFPKGTGLDITTMTAEDILSVQKNQVFDWLLSNHDSHSGNFLQTADGIVAIDKGQSFKFFGHDKLDYNYQPVSPLDGNVSVYQRIWKQFSQGKGALFDPSEGELKGTIQRIMAIPDAEYRKLLTPYAIKAAAAGSLSAPGNNKSEKVENFLKAAVERKNNLQKDFDAYYAKVKAEHDANKPKGPIASSKLKAAASQPVAAAPKSRKAFGDAIYPNDLQAGMYFAMKKSDGSPGPSIKITKIEGDKVWTQTESGDVTDLPHNFFQAGNFIVAKPWAPKVSFSEVKQGDLITYKTVTGDEKYNFKVSFVGATTVDVVDVDQNTSNTLYKSNFDNGQITWTNGKLTVGQNIDGIDQLKVGDKIKAPWGDEFTVTAIHPDGDDPYVETSNAMGGIGGNLYASSIKLANEGSNPNPFGYAGNIHDQGSVDANDLAGQPITDINNVIPGDKLIIQTGIKNNAEMEVVVTNINDAPTSIYVKKTSTGGVVKLLKSDFTNGNVKMAYAKADVVDSPSDFKPINGKAEELDIFAGDEVSISDGTSVDTGKVHFVSTKHGGQIDVEVGGSNQPVEFFPVMKGGVISWVDDPQSFLDGDPVSVLGTGGSASSASNLKPINALHELGPGDVIVDDVGIKYTVDDIGSAIFANGYVTVKKFGSNIAWKIYGSDLKDYKLESSSSGNFNWPTYDPVDIYGGQTKTSAPGTTLATLKVPGWGGYVGSYKAGDPVVAYGANGQFKQGKVASISPKGTLAVSWDDDPSGDWGAFSKNAQGFYGDTPDGEQDSWTLVGKIHSATTSNPPTNAQVPLGPSSAPQAAAIPTVATPNAGKPASFDALDVGMVYHIPGGKMQKVISKDADSFVAQSISGNQHTYPKEKFNTWAASKGALLGAPGAGEPAPNIGEVADGEIYILPKDPFAPNSTQHKLVVKSWTPKEVNFTNLGTGESITIKASEWDEKAQGWKRVPGLSDWEKYSQGLISWEEYQKSSLHEDVRKLHGHKLHSPEGPAAPGKPTPAADFAAKKKSVEEKKLPPPWSSIKGIHVKEMGAEVYALKKAGKLEDDHQLYLACGKVIRAWKKKYPNETGWPSNNQLRHAARRLEYEENGVVVWETEEQQTAIQVGDVQTGKTAIEHVPTGKYTGQSSNKVPLTSFGDSKKLPGSYQNPIHFGYHGDAGVWDKIKLFGSDLTPQNKSNYTAGEKEVISSYTGGGYSAINGYLRTGTVGYGSSSGLATSVKNMDSAFAKSNPAPDWFLACRGAGGGYDFGLASHNFTLEEARAQIGKTVLNKGYTSGSLGSQPGYGGSYCRIIYRVPPGLKALWVSGDKNGHSLSSQGVGEREIILPRNLKVKVLAVEENTQGMSYKYDVIVEVVGWEGQGK